MKHKCLNKWQFWEVFCFYLFLYIIIFVELFFQKSPLTAPHDLKRSNLNRILKNEICQIFGSFFEKVAIFGDFSPLSFFLQIVFYLNFCPITTLKSPTILFKTNFDWLLRNWESNFWHVFSDFKNSKDLQRI